MGYILVSPRAAACASDRAHRIRDLSSRGSSDIFPLCAADVFDAGTDVVSLGAESSGVRSSAVRIAIARRRMVHRVRVPARMRRIAARVRHALVHRRAHRVDLLLLADFILPFPVVIPSYLSHFALRVVHQRRGQNVLAPDAAHARFHVRMGTGEHLRAASRYHSDDVHLCRRGIAKDVAARMAGRCGTEHVACRSLGDVMGAVGGRAQSAVQLVLSLGARHHAHRSDAPVPAVVEDLAMVRRARRRIVSHRHRRADEHLVVHRVNSLLHFVLAAGRGV